MIISVGSQSRSRLDHTLNQEEASLCYGTTHIDSQ